MGYLQTGIEMRDQFNVVLMSFVNSMTAAVTAANDFSDVMNQNINTNPLDHVRGEIQSVTEELDALNQSASTPLSPDVSADQSIQRLNERIEQTGDLLDRVSGIQQSIGAGSARVEVLPDETQENIQRANERLLEMQAEMDQISQNPFDMPTDEVETQLVSLQERIRETLQEQLALNEELSHMDMENEQPPPWQSDDLEIFNGSGAERFHQEIQAANVMLEQLGRAQREIALQASRMNILPPEAIQDMNGLAGRIDHVRQRIHQIESHPLRFASSRTNGELQQLRAHLSQALALQEEMNRAMQRMDVRGANEAYLRLSRIISGAESRIRDNTGEQEHFNRAIQGGAGKAQNLVRSLMGLSVVQSTISMIRGQFDAAISRMDTMTNFSRTMTAITGSSESASGSLESLKSMTKGTAYGLDTAAAAVQNFTTRGMEIGSATTEVGKWADAVAFYGDGTNETLTTVTDAIGKMLTKGTVEMDQLNRLTDAGINAVGMYAQATGRDAAKVQEHLSKGKISAQDFVTTVSSAFEEGTNGVLNISGAAKEAGATWATTISNMKAAVTRGITSMLDEINESLSEAGLGTIQDGIKEIGEVTENVLGTVGTFLGQGIAFFAEHREQIMMTIQVLGSLAAAYIIVSAAVGIVTAALTACQVVMTTFGTTAAIAFGVVGVLAVLGIAAAIFSLIEWIKDLNEKTGDSGKTMELVFKKAEAVMADLGYKWALISGTMQILWNSFCLGFVVAFRGSYGTVLEIVYLIGDAIRSLVNGAILMINDMIRSLNQIPGINLDLIEEVQWKGLDDFGKYAQEQLDAVYDMTIETDLKNQEILNGILDKKNAADKAKREYDELYTLYTSGNEVKGVEGEIQATSDLPAITKNTGDTAKAAQKAAQSLDITGENLKYIKDMAEREYVNRFTTAKISVKQTNHNKVKSNMDLDGINEYLRSDLEQRMVATAEGVH